MKQQFAHSPNTFAIPVAPEYDESIRLNIERWGGNEPDTNWNSPAYAWVGTGSVVADLTGFISGTATGIGVEVTNGAFADFNSGKTMSSSTNFPAPAYARGGNATNAGVFEFKFVGLSSSIVVECIVAVGDGNNSVISSGTVSVSDGASTINTAVDGTITPVEYEFIGESTASGEFFVTLTADSGGSNYVSINAVIINYDTP